MRYDKVMTYNDNPYHLHAFNGLATRDSSLFLMTRRQVVKIIEDEKFDFMFASHEIVKSADFIDSNRLAVGTEKGVIYIRG